MAINDIYELTVTTNVDGELCNQVFHYSQLASDGALSPIQALKNGWVATMLPLFRACLSVQAAVETLRVRKLLPTLGGSALFLIDEEGDISGDSLPPNSVAIIALYGPAAGVHKRGRTHMSGYPESKHSDGIIDADMQTNYNALGAGLCADIVVGGGEPSFRGGILNPLSGALTDFTYYQTRPHLYTLRSRRLASKLT